MYDDYSRGKPVRFNYENAFGDSDGQTYPFCLPDAFRRIILQVIDRALWSPVVWGGVELSETERQTIERGIYALTAVDGCMSQIEDMVTITINNTNNNNATGGAGGAGGASSIPVYTGGAGDCQCLPLAPPGSETPPPVTVTPGIPPDGWTDYNAYDAARCAIANYGWQLVYEWLTALSNVTESALSLGAFVFFLLNFAPGIVFAIFSAGWLATLLAFLAQLAAYTQPFDDLFDDARAWWVENREDIICQAYQAQAEIPLYQSIFTALSDYLDGLWIEREYSETLVYILSRVLYYALPSALMGLLMQNEDEDFFGTYQSPIPCDCGETGPSPEDAWVYDNEAGTAVSWSYYDDNDADEFSLTGVHAGAGAGNSYQTLKSILQEYVDVDPETFPFVAIAGSVGISLAAPAGNYASRRWVRVGGPNTHTDLLDVPTPADTAVSENVTVSFWVGLTGQTPPGTNDVEIVVNNPAYLIPSIRLVGIGYGITNTTYDIVLSNFQLVAA